MVGFEPTSAYHLLVVCATIQIQLFWATELHFTLAKAPLIAFIIPHFNSPVNRRFLPHFLHHEPPPLPVIAPELLLDNTLTLN